MHVCFSRCLLCVNVCQEINCKHKLETKTIEKNYAYAFIIFMIMVMIVILVIESAVFSREASAPLPIRGSLRPYSCASRSLCALQLSLRIGTFRIVHWTWLVVLCADGSSVLCGDGFAVVDRSEGQAGPAGDCGCNFLWPNQSRRIFARAVLLQKVHLPL